MNKQSARKSKFRAWSTEEKKWMADDELKWLPLRSLYNEDGCSDRIIFQQWTGSVETSKDKRDVYEGDIVEIEAWGRQKIVGPIVFFRGAFSVAYDQDYWYLNPGIKITILGNIFEHKHLTKKTERQ